MSENNTEKTEKDDGFDFKKLITVENAAIVRSYLLGFKKNGKPRSIYDVYKDQFGRDSKHGGKKKKKADKFSLYIEPGSKGKKGKKKGKKKKKSHWEF